MKKKERNILLNNMNIMCSASVKLQLREKNKVFQRGSYSYNTNAAKIIKIHNKNKKKVFILNKILTEGIVQYIKNNT